MTGMSKAEQPLSFRNMPLTSAEQTLGDQGIVHGDVLTLHAATPYVTVHLPDELCDVYGSSVTVVAGPSDTLDHVKAAVTAQTRLHTKSMLLSYEGPQPWYIIVKLPPPLQKAHGPKTTLAVDQMTPSRGPCLWTPVATIKAKLEAQTGVPCAEQSLFFGIIPLGSADDETLGEYGVRNGGTIELLLPRRHEDGYNMTPFVVRVEMPSSLQPMHDSLMAVQTSTDETVGDVKGRVQAITGMSVAAQELIFYGVTLSENDMTLDAAQIMHGDSIQLRRPRVDGSTLGSLGVPSGGDLDLVLIRSSVEAKETQTISEHVDNSPRVEPSSGRSATKRAPPRKPPPERKTKARPPARPEHESSEESPSTEGSSTMQVTTRIENDAPTCQDWHELHALISIHVPAALPFARAPIELVCVIDTSGSMEGEKLRAMQHTLRFLVRHGLGDEDKVSAALRSVAMKDISNASSTDSAYVVMSLTCVHRLVWSSSTRW
jgi:hypothetical protein